MMVVSPIVVAVHEHCLSPEAALRRNRFHFDSSWSSGSCLDSPTFQFPQKRLTSFKRPAGVDGLFHSSHFSELGTYARQ
ncbi:hypothetical protein TNCV_5036921 [Trichonephila clavipes]|nr:hypothetical protein TNCV_5036921 [Trichonephila clavipes]